jgi:hypothetical protein
LISFFRLNDPYRIIGIFILLLIIRLPALLGFVPLLQPELGWMLLGESLAEGRILYEGVWDNTGPFSAMVYWLTDLIFGRSQLALYLISTLLIVVQAYLFNSLLLRYKAYNESTYVPSLVYMLLANMFYDFFTLSPVVLCLSFLLLALRNLFRLIVGAGTDETIFFLGLFTGISALFFLPSIAFLIAFFFALIIFTGTKPRQYMLLLFGLLLPLASVTLYFAWQGVLDDFYWQYVQSLGILTSDAYLSLLSLLLLSLVPAIFLLVGIYRFNNTRAFNNYQIRLQQSVFYYLLMGLAAIFFSPEMSAYHLMLLLPALAFYISHYFLLLRNRLQTELFFLVLMVLILGLHYGLLIGDIPYVSEYVNAWTNYQELEVQQRPEHEFVGGKRILTLGNDLSLYREARLATPYLDWDLAAQQLTQLHYYENLLEAYKNFSQDPPQVLIDDAGIVPELFERMPILKNKYRQESRYSHVYLLKEQE